MSSKNMKQLIIKHSLASFYLGSAQNNKIKLSRLAVIDLVCAVLRTLPIYTAFIYEKKHAKLGGGAPRK